MVSTIQTSIKKPALKDACFFYETGEGGNPVSV
jgi:hypothetical protein